MWRCIAGLLFLWSAGAGTAAETVVLGNSLPLTGPLGGAGLTAHAGMKAYLARVERAGGVAGRRVVLRSLDDAYSVERHVENVRQLLEKEQVDALVLSAGTSHIDAAYPLVHKSGKPLIGTVSGGAALRTRERPLIFHLRASYGDEVRRLVEQVRTVSQSRVYAVWQDDGLGRDAFGALEAALAAGGIELVGQRAVALAAIDGAAIAGEVRASRADALFLLCVTPCAAKVLSALDGAGTYKLTPYALSIVNGETLSKQLGAAARGTVISQVFPNPQVPTSSLVRRYQEDLRALTGKSEFSYFSLEAYVTAMVAVEAVRIAHGGPVRRTMDEAMRTLMQREFEGLPISSGIAKGARPHPVTLSMIGAGGRLIH